MIYTLMRTMEELEAFIDVIAFLVHYCRLGFPRVIQSPPSQSLTETTKGCFCVRCHLYCKLSCFYLTPYSLLPVIPTIIS